MSGSQVFLAKQLPFCFTQCFSAGGVRKKERRMSKRNWSKKPWYPYAVAGIIIVIVFVFLQNIDSFGKGVVKFLSFFAPVFLSILLAYIMNQLSNFYQKHLFKKVKKRRLSHVLSIALTVITVLAFIVFLGITLIPQLIDSVTTFITNLNRYERSAETFLKGLGLFQNIDLSGFLASSESFLDFTGNYVLEHLNNLLSTVANAGRGIVSVVISFILAVYFMAEKDRFRSGFKRLLKALFKTKESGYDRAASFLKKCDLILKRYVVYNFLDALIVGVVNFLFMTIVRLPYGGLISFLVAITNLVPTFGPLVGGVIGALLLFLIKPSYMLIWVIFTLALQTCDGYIIKPKLFGTTLGVSTAWILIAIIVAGRMFGVVGIFLSIPGIAIIDLLYKDYFLKWLENRKPKKEEEQ